MRSDPAAPARTLTLATAVSALALLVAGSLVNSQQAALSVPDWPTSYGRWLLTEWPGNTAYEQIHRLLAVLTTLLAAAAWWVTRRNPATRGAARLAGWTLVLIGVQILLGGVVVLARTPPLVSAVHVLVAVAVVCLATLAAGRARAVAPAVVDDAWPRKALRWALAMATLQLVLGAVSRHPPLGQTPFIVTLLAHIANGLALGVLLPVLGVKLYRRRHTPATRRLGALLVWLAVAQVAVGVWVFLISPEPLAETWPPPPGFPLGHALHLALASLIATALVAVRGLAARPASAGAAT